VKCPSLSHLRSPGSRKNDTGCGAFGKGDPIAWQVLRRYELGVRVEF
jgi:hypothetical protein